MLPPPDTPCSCHHAQLDSNLLRQVIAIDVETAVRHLEDEENRIIDNNTQHNWIEQILAEIQSGITMHSIQYAPLPQVLNERIRHAIKRLSADIPHCELHYMATQRRTFFPVIPRLRLLYRAFFEKRRE